MNLNLLLHAHYNENILRHFRLIETRLDMERPKDSWHIPWSFHSRQWRGWRTIDWNPALSHQTESHNAVRKCMPLTMIQSASERECQESLWTKRYVISSPSNKIFLTSAQVSSLPTERARVSEVPLNSKQRWSLLQTYTNQVFLTFAHLSTFQTGWWRVSS